MAWSIEAAKTLSVGEGDYLDRPARDAPFTQANEAFAPVDPQAGCGTRAGWSCCERRHGLPARSLSERRLLSTIASAPPRIRCTILLAPFHAPRRQQPAARARAQRLHVNEALQRAGHGPRRATLIARGCSGPGGNGASLPGPASAQAQLDVQRAGGRGRGGPSRTASPESGANRCANETFRPKSGHPTARARSPSAGACRRPARPRGCPTPRRARTPARRWPAG